MSYNRPSERLCITAHHPYNSTYQTRVVLGDPLEDRNEAKSKHTPRQPYAGRESLQQDVARNLEKDIRDEENSQS